MLCHNAYERLCLHMASCSCVCACTLVIQLQNRECLQVCFSPVCLFYKQHLWVKTCLGAQILQSSGYFLRESSQECNFLYISSYCWPWKQCMKSLVLYKWLSSYKRYFFTSLASAAFSHRKGSLQRGCLQEGALGERRTSPNGCCRPWSCFAATCFPSSPVAAV